MSAVGNYETIKHTETIPVSGSSVTFVYTAPAGKVLLGAGWGVGPGNVLASYPNSDGTQWTFVNGVAAFANQTKDFYLVAAEMGC